MITETRGISLNRTESPTRVGDAKTYNHLEILKLDYGNELAWLLPFPGDFHILKNYQPVLSKIYFDAGLKQLAAVGGHRSETLISLQNCSHFKRTHRFILQVWEALYVNMVEIFLNNEPEAAELLLHQTRVSGIVPTFRDSYATLLHIRSQFDTFAASMAETDPNWKFWHEFVSLNGIALFLSIRSANWDLRLGSLKLMAPVFCTFDRPIYRKLIPQHLADCLLLPDEIQDKFAAGGFSVSITGRPWHSVGLDEAHEMLINKDCKMAVVRPTKEFVSRMALYFPFRSRVMHNFQHQLTPEASSISNEDKSPTSLEKKIRESVEVIREALKKSKLLPSDPTEVLQDEEEQQNDLLNFRAIGKN